MNIIHLCNNDQGIGQIPYHLNQSMNTVNGIPSLFMVKETKNHNEYCKTTFSLTTKNRFTIMGKELVSDFIAKMSYNHQLKKYTPTAEDFYPLSTIDCFHTTLKAVKKIEYDIIHIHHTSQNFISTSLLKRLDFQKPLIISLHKAFWFTGGCHYLDLGKCERYQSGCGMCPVLHSSKKKDLSFRTFESRLSLFKNRKIGVISPSLGIQNKAKLSPIFKNALFSHIPNPIDTLTFKPVQKSSARTLLNLPENHLLIGFGALSPFSSEATRKGFQPLIESLSFLKTQHNSSTPLSLVCFGQFVPPDIKKLFPFPILDLGFIASDLHLSLLYNSLDVLAFPSLFEVLPNTIAEALSCGTPVVAFNISGPDEQILHKESGYLASSSDPKDFAMGLEFILTHPSPQTLSLNASLSSSSLSFAKATTSHLDFYSKFLDLGLNGTKL